MFDHFDQWSNENWGAWGPSWGGQCRPRPALSPGLLQVAPLGQLQVDLPLPVGFCQGHLNLHHMGMGAA